MNNLHYTILRSSYPDKAIDPIVAMQGGTGGKALEIMDYWLYILDNTLLILISTVSLILVPLIWRL